MPLHVVSHPLVEDVMARLRDPERGREETAAVRHLFGLDRDEG